LSFGVEKLCEDEQRVRTVWEVREIMFGSGIGKKRTTG
jgi:hypothetical protein